MSALIDAVLEDLTALTSGLYEFLLRPEAMSTRRIWQQQLETIRAYTQKIQARAGQGGQQGLHDACAYQSTYLDALLLAGVAPSPLDWERLERWPLLLLPCLARPVAVAALDELLKYYRSDVPELSLNTQHATALRANFLQPTSPVPLSGTARLFTLPLGKARAPLATVIEPPLHRGLSNDISVRYLLQHELMDALSEYVYCSEHGDAGSASRLYADRTQLLGISAAGGGLIGLMDCCLLCHDALNLRIAEQGVLTAEDNAKLQIWAGLIAHYLDAPQDRDGIDALIAFYQHGHLIPLMQAREYDQLRDFLLHDGADAMQPRIRIEVVKPRTTSAEIVRLPVHRPVLQALADANLAELQPSAPAPLMPNLPVPDDAPPQRATQARTEDVSLHLPPDVNPKLLAVLLHELPQHAEEFSACVQRIAAGHGSPRDVASAQRNAHTLKGAANTVGVVGIATLAHHIEDLLTTYAVAQRVPEGAIAATLLAASDVLEAMAETLLGTGSAPEDAQATLQNVLDCANLIDRDGLPALTPITSTAAPAAARLTIATPVAVPSAKEKALALLRVPAPVIDNLIRLVGESITVSAQLQDRLRQSMRVAKETSQQNELLQRLVYELERSIEITTSGAYELEHNQLLRTLTQQLREAVTDAREFSNATEDHLANCDELLASQVRNHKESQDTVMRARMVPVNSIVARLQRAVRQTSQTTGKNVNLRVIGADTLLDSDILDIVVEPLMHVLRNAVDHGIETPAQRTACGKSELGIIELSFVRDGDHVRVCCHDDGRGLDYSEIKRIAVAKRLLAAHENISEEDLSRFILLPGFTTRTDVTQVSGRGIGLDAVHTCMLQMKGAMKITSQPGAGCDIELRVPLTLLSIHALLVQLNSQVMAVSTRGVEKIVYSGAGQILLDNDRLRFSIDGMTYAAYELETLLHLPVDRGWIKHSDRSALLVRDTTSRGIIVFIEHVFASQELVVKQLGPYLPKIHGIEGATILGNGGIAAVADLPGLLQTARHDLPLPWLDRTVLNSHESHEQPDVPALRALVVDDSLSARRGLAEAVKDLGFDVRTAVDGVDALDQINVQIPDLLLLDLEMPRMNGLELTEQLRAVTRTCNLPIIMITAQSTKKYRDQALAVGVNTYLTKPYLDEELSECIHTLLEKVMPSPMSAD